MLDFVRRVLRRARAVPPRAINGSRTRVLVHRPRLIEHPALITIGDGTVIREHGWLSAMPNYAGRSYRPALEIGRNVYIGRYVCITCMDRVSIGDNCVLSEHVYVADSGHGIDPTAGHIMTQPLESKGPVTIGEGTFIGYGARIVSGVTLGRHCVVGANSVVTRSFPEYTMIAGMPARPIKSFNQLTRTWEIIA